MSSSVPEDGSSNSQVALMGMVNDITQQEQPTQDEVEASRSFEGESFDNLRHIIKELDRKLIAEEAAEKARARRDKKYAPVRFVKTFFGKNGNKKPAQDQPQSQLVKPVDEKHDNEHAHDVNDGLIQPSPYTKPLEHRLLPRMEQANLTPSNMNALIRNPNAPPSAIAIARARGEAALALFGPQTISLDDSAVTSFNNNSIQTRAARRRRSSDVESIDINQPLSIDAEALLGYNREEMSYSPSYEPDEPRSYTQQVAQYQRQDIEYVVMQIAQDPSFYGAWQQYLESYSQGHFNLINPPPPPPLSPSFEYLPGVFPPGEANRMRLSHQYDILWPQWGQDKAGDLIRLAMKKFKTKCVSLSFFDEDNEIFKAENGYNQFQVDRTVSLASHCILSKEVLVVLDATEDWRFANNPLVITQPYIRFWAGAPMMSACGEVLGVFAIFSPRARVSFTPVQRRELAEFTSLVMRDLKLQVDALEDLQQRSTPILERDSLINAPFQAQSVNSVVGDDGLESDLVPSALTYHKARPPKTMQSRLFINGTSQEVLIQHSEQTPPSSAQSSSGYFETPTTLENGQNGLSEHFKTTTGQSFQESLKSSSSGFRVSSPRAFSSSDLTSLHPHPPNTPVHSVRGADLSSQPKFDLDWNDFKDLTDEDCAEPIQQNPAVAPRTVRRLRSGRFIGASNMKPKFSNLKSIASLADYEQEQSLNYRDKNDSRNRRRYMDSGASNHLIREQIQDSSVPPYGYFQKEAADISSSEPPNEPHAWPVSQTANSSPLIDLSTPDSKDMSHPPMRELNSIKKSPSMRLRNMPSASTAYAVDSPWDVSDENLEGAAYACAFHAQTFGYDLIYACEIKPARQFMSDEELLAPHGLHKKILVAYGLTRPLELASDTHLRVLRSRGGEHWKDDLADTRYGEADYQAGLLIPVTSEGGPRSQRSWGIVMGAFRKSKRMAYRNVQSPATDMQSLVDFGEHLRDIFQPKDREHHRSNMATPYSSYPANEAREVELKPQAFEFPRSFR